MLRLCWIFRTQTPQLSDQIGTPHTIGLYPSIWNGLPLTLCSLPKILYQAFISQLKMVFFGHAGFGAPLIRPPPDEALYKYPQSMNIDCRLDRSNKTNYNSKLWSPRTGSSSVSKQFSNHLYCLLHKQNRTNGEMMINFLAVLGDIFLVFWFNCGIRLFCQLIRAVQKYNFFCIWMWSWTVQELSYKLSI